MRRLNLVDAYLHQYIYRGTPKTLPENLRYHLATLLGIHESELRETARDIAIPDAVFLPWLDIDISASHGSISDDLAEAGDSWVFDRQFLQQISRRYICITDAVCEGGFHVACTGRWRYDFDRSERQTAQPARNFRTV